MRKVKLADGRVIANCTNSTTTTEIYILRENYGDAGAMRDSFTPENSKNIVVYDENDEEITSGVDLILNPGCELIDSTEEDGIICKVTTRVKTDIEKMQDEIVELQEVIIEG